jgi:uncharacterized membrane protein YidH (DUF202 family)
MKQSSLVALAVVMVMPVMALAQFGEINDFVGQITDFINNILIPLVFAVALLFFIWGMFKFFIYGGADDDERTKGRNLMVWSIVAFVLMVSIFGIVNLIAGGLGFSDEQNIQNIPNVPTGNV